MKEKNKSEDYTFTHLWIVVSLCILRLWYCRHFYEVSWEKIQSETTVQPQCCKLMGVVATRTNY
jgi:hypothetical protein